MTTEKGSLPNRWDDAADIVVIGSGFAGFAAAAGAASAGSSVIVIEKMAQYGGNSAITRRGTIPGTGAPLRGWETTARSGTPLMPWPPASITATPTWW